MKKLTIIVTFLIYASRELEALNCEQIRQFVNGHNERRLRLARGEVRGQPAASDMTTMVWDNELADKAQRYADRFPQFHNPDKTVPSRRFRRVGENLYWWSTTDRNFELEPQMALDLWWKEHKDYSYGPLRESDFDRPNKQIGHYTQMAWAETMFVGCGISHNFNGRWKKFYVVCNYGPAGNTIGRTPYERGRFLNNLLCKCKKYDKNCNCNRPYGRRCSN